MEACHAVWALSAHPLVNSTLLSDIDDIESNVLFRDHAEPHRILVAVLLDPAPRA